VRRVEQEAVKHQWKLVFF